MEQINGPVTIDRLVTEADRRGYNVGARLIRDWTAAGLLDYPERRGAGKGHGSRAALYSANQAELLMTLLHHRPTNGIKSLARIPVGIWMYFGDAYVHLAQVRRAMTTWLGDPRSSLREARESAQEMLRQLDNRHATEAARKVLLDTLSGIAHTGRLDSAQLERAVRDVFEPGSSQIRRVVGHPDAPLMVESFLGVIRARMLAVDQVTQGQLTDDDFNNARHAHLVTFAEYAAQQSQLAAFTPAGTPGMYEPVTAELALNSACGNLLTTIGMAAMSPDGAARLASRPTPHVRFQFHPYTKISPT
jgi:hypothetical protein